MAKKAVIRMAVSILICLALIATPISVSAMNFDFDVAAHSVFIVASSSGFGSISFGSGFAIDEHHIVTNAHVITNKNDIAVISYSENAQNNIGDEYVAELIAIDRVVDLAVLYIDDITLTPLKFADASTIKEGDPVFAIGTPENLPYTLTTGTVSSKLRVSDDVKYVQTDAGITYGSSGGPLLNNDGEVIGVNTLGSATTEIIRFAIRVDELEDFLNKNLHSDNENSSATNSSNKKPIYDNEPQPDDSEITSIDYYAYLGIVAVGILLVGIIAAIVIVCVRPKKKHSSFDVPIIQAENISDIVPQNLQNTLTPEIAGIRILSGNMAGAEFEISKNQNAIVGKDPMRANIALDTTYTKVSRLHCTIFYSNTSNKYYVTDCSTNGIYYKNGARLEKNTRTALERGTILKFADDNCIIKLL